jgi:phosphoglycolate phosphatase
MKRCNLKYTHILWDFNGTILSDMEAGMDSTNSLLAERTLPMIPSIDVYRDIFDFPIRDYYKDLGFDFDVEPYEVLAPLWVALYNKNSKHSRLSDGVLETLSAVKDAGISQSILSASEKGMLEAQLSSLGVRDYFDDVIGLDNIRAESKLYLAEAWRKENPDAKVLFIGDTGHDADTAKVLCADCLLFSGGHQSKKRLEALGYPVIDRIIDVLEMLK